MRACPARSPRLPRNCWISKLPAIARVRKLGLTAMARCRGYSRTRSGKPEMYRWISIRSFRMRIECANLCRFLRRQLLFVITPDPPRCRPSHHGGELFLPGRAYQLRTHKMLEQPLHGLLAHALDAVQLRSQPLRVAARAVEGDREAMRLVADGLHQVQDRRE